MTNYAARGNSFDLEVARECESGGGLVASRRHTGGAGDLLVVWPDDDGDEVLPSLIECKTAKGSPYKNFTRADRKAMRTERERLNGRLALWLVWRRTGSREIQWVHESEWPEAKVAA